MHFHEPGSYLEWEYRDKHGFDYSHGQDPVYGASAWSPLGLSSEPSPGTSSEEQTPKVPTERSSPPQANAEGFVSGLISDKSRFAKASVVGLARQIEERQRIKEDNLTQIEYEKCRVGTFLEELFLWGDRALSDKRRQTLDMVMFGLERERRMEEVSCWRDVSLLRKDLIGSVADYVAASRREALFGNASYLG